MSIKVTEFPRLDEVLYSYEHPSGLKAFVLPKKGYAKSHAAFATHFGSINNKFVIPGQNNITTVPDGVAHFLEHKVFEQEDGNVSDKFTKLGAYSNAYTSFNQTVYLFSCTDSFDENFHLLLDFVQNPYITPESIEKEKGIIGQEINMYQDDPEWRVFFNLLGAFYKKNPVCIDIAGTIESISEIDKDVLYKCYNTFYHPSNMVIFATGNVDPYKVFEEIDKKIKATDHPGEVLRILDNDHGGVNKPYVSQKLAVSAPLFRMGFKEETDGSSGIVLQTRETTMRILLQMIFGRSSNLYTKLYDAGLINDTFDFDYSIEENYAFSMMGGESKSPLEVKEAALAEIDKLKKTGLNRSDFERIKSAVCGGHVKLLNNIERTGSMFISTLFRKANLFDYFDICDKITFEQVEAMFKQHFVTENFALSVIEP